MYLSKIDKTSICILEIFLSVYLFQRAQEVQKANNDDVIPVDEAKFVSTMKLLHELTPWLYGFVLNAGPFADQAFVDKQANGVQGISLNGL